MTDDLNFTPTDMARALAIEAGLLDPNGLGLVAMTPEARSEAARKSWLTRQRNKAGAGEVKPKAARPDGAPTAHPSEDTRSGLPPHVLKAVGEGTAQCFKHTQATGNEAFVVVGADGARIGMTLGGPDSVPTGGLASGQKAKDGVDIHSHPCRASFSDQDIENFADQSSTRHSVVIGSDGTIYRMSKPKGWRERTPEEYDAALKKAVDSGRQIDEFNYKKEYDKRMKVFKDPSGMKKYMKTYKGESKNLRDDWWEQSTSDTVASICKKLGLVYSREKKA